MYLPPSQVDPVVNFALPVLHQPIATEWKKKNVDDVINKQDFPYISDVVFFRYFVILF
jgi:hypothetical protein